MLAIFLVGRGVTSFLSLRANPATVKPRGKKWRVLLPPRKAR